MNSYCVIPARAGSKRIPRKNLYNINGKPLIAYIIETALNSKVFDSVIVSTDSEEIAEESRKYGALVPELRSPELSNDYVGTHPVIQDTIRKLYTRNLEETVVMCLYATAILINPSQIKLGYEKFLSETNRHPLLTLCRYSHPIERAFEKRGDIYQPVSPENMLVRTQDFGSKWFDAGQFYLAMAGDWLSQDKFTGPFNGLIIPSDDVTDIDTFEDLERAKKKLHNNNKNL
jgi:pseudaminic acid cytidylyltransferase